MDALEELRQENHRLLLKYESLKNSTTLEIEYLKDELQEKDLKHKEQLDKIISETRAKETAFNERIHSLTEDLNSYKEDLDRLKEQNQNLKISLEHHKSRNNEALTRKSTLPITMDQYEELQESLLEKDKVIARSDETIANQSERLREYSEALEEQRRRVAELNEEMETLRMEAVEMQERNRQMEAERNEQIKKNQQNALEKCETQSRGNSLFSEVDERRVKVEDEFKKLKERVDRLTKENIELNALIESGDRRNSAVTNQLIIIQKSEEQVIKEFKQLKSERVNLYDSLRERLDRIRNDYIKRLTEYQENGGIVSEEVEKILDERDKLLSAKINVERDLFECKKELKFQKHTKIELEAHLKILRAKLQEKSEKNSPFKKALPAEESNSNHVELKTETSDNSCDSNKTTNLSKHPNKNSAEEITECKQQ